MARCGTFNRYMVLETAKSEWPESTIILKSSGLAFSQLAARERRLIEIRSGLDMPQVKRPGMV